MADRETRSNEIGRAEGADAHSMPNQDPLEVALVLAAEAGRFDVVAQLAKEIEARRLEGAGIVDLEARRKAGPAARVDARNRRR